MENNQPMPQTPQTPLADPAAIPPQQPVAQVSIPTPSSGGSNKILLWFAVGLVVIVLLAGGVYLFLSKQQAANPEPETAVQTPAPSIETTLENELNGLNVENSADSDFAPVDQDLQSL